jgi:predicted methyltransferase
MRFLILGLAAALTLASISGVDAQSVSPEIAAAVANPARPAADRDVDSLRKPAESVAFAGVKPGDRVIDLMPGRGYFTRVFSGVVGPKGHVYAMVAEEMSRGSTKGVDAMTQLAKEFPNVSALVQPMSRFKVDAPVDLVWTSLNYHDLHIPSLGVDIKGFNKAAFDALKPGGVFLVLDHAAAQGSGLRDVETLHRIDPATARAEIEAAGFVFEASSDLLAESGDAHTGKIFDADVRGKTDKFIYKFRKR